MMTKFDPKRFSEPELFRCFAEILDELRTRGVVRTRNNPVADYAEWLVSRKLGLELMRNSSSGYDAIGANGKRFQIKSRRLDPSNSSRQLSVIRNLDAKEFDFLIGVIFERDFTVREAYKIPHKIIVRFARFSEHQNGHILHLRGDVLNAAGVENIMHVLTNSPTTQS